MGRYTTVQTYTDQDAKVAAIPYATASATRGVNAQGVDALLPQEQHGVEPSSSAGGEDPAVVPKDAKFKFNRVDNVAGSSAGAGSGEFHMYRASRRRELERVSRMETQHARAKEQDEFQQSRKRKMEEFDARAQKRADRRRRRKEHSKVRSMMEGGDGEGKGKGDGEGEGEGEAMPARDGTQVTAETKTTASVEILDDGSFLEKMLALQKQKEATGDTEDGGAAT